MTPDDYQSARRQLFSRLTDLQRLRDRVRDEEPKLYEELPRSVRDKFPRLDREISRLSRDDLTVAFVGGFSAGKSSLVNALIGTPLLPEDTTVTTAVPTFLREAGSEGEGIELHWLSAAEADSLERSLKQDLAREIGRPDLGGCPVSDLQEAAREAAHDGRGKALLQFLERFLEERPRKSLGDRGRSESKPLEELARVARDEDTARFLDRIVVRKANLGLPDDVTLVDLPGISAPNPRHRDLTFRFVTTEAHAVVLVLNATQVWTADVVDILQKFREGESQISDRAVFVINRWDALNSRQQESTLSEFVEKLREFAIPDSCRPFTTNALHGLLATLPHGEAVGGKHGADWERALEISYAGDREAAWNESGIPEVRRHLDVLLGDRLRNAVLSSASAVAIRDVADPLLAPLRDQYDETKRILEEEIGENQRQAVRERAESIVAARAKEISDAISEARNLIVNKKADLFAEKTAALRERLEEEIQNGSTTNAHRAYQAIMRDGYLRAYPYYFEIEIRVVDDLNRMLKQQFLMIVRDQIRIPINGLLAKLNGVIKAVRTAAGPNSRVGEELKRRMDDFDRTFDATIEGAVEMEAAALDKLLMYHPPEGVLQKVIRNQNPLLDQLAEAAHELAGKFLAGAAVQESDFERKTHLIRKALQSRYIESAEQFQKAIVTKAPPMVGNRLSLLAKDLEEILRRRFADVAEMLAKAEVEERFASQRAEADNRSKRLVAFIERLETIKEAAVMCREGRSTAPSSRLTGNGEVTPADDPDALTFEHGPKPSLAEDG